MKNYLVLPLTLIAAAVLASCSTVPAGDSPLAQARSEYSNAQANPQVAAYAALELKHASDSLDRANNAASKGEKGAVVDHLAYVAKQQVAIAQETARQKAAEMAVANASAERDRVRLEARTREADLAQRNAELAQRQAEASRASALAAQRESEASQRQSEASRLSAEAAQRQAAAEKQAATEAQMSAQAARQQAQEAEARARQLEAQLKDLEAKKTERGMVITLGDVLFDTNQAQLKPGGMRNVQKLADFFKQYPQRTVMIEGFTDSTGTAGRNQELSEQRAYSVRTALVGMGVGADRITSKGYGPAYPVAGNDNAAGRQLNRRVEIVVSDDSGKIAPR
jgi:outer membrane protein OmpA-like peptidoglycan-associated protein